MVKRCIWGILPVVLLVVACGEGVHSRSSFLHDPSEVLHLDLESFQGPAFLFNGVNQWQSGGTNQISFWNSSSLHFSSTQDYLKFDDPTLAISGDYTLSAWFNFTSTGTFMPLISSTDFSLDRPHNRVAAYELQIQNIGRLNFFAGNGTLSNYGCIMSPSFPSQNAWHHTALTMSGTQGSFYLDGELVSTCTFVGTRRVYSKVQVGHFVNQGGEQIFVGDLADVRIFNVAKSASDILELYGGKRELRQ